MGIAVTLIVLMAITAVLTMVLVMQVGGRIEDLTYRYIPAYGDLARAMSVRWSVRLRYAASLSKLQPPVDDVRYKSLRDRYEALDGQVELEIQAARALIYGLIEKGPTFADVATLSRFETRLDAINDDFRRRLNAENKRLLACSMPARPRLSTTNSNASTSCAMTSTGNWMAYARICSVCCATTPTRR